MHSGLAPGRPIYRLGGVEAALDVLRRRSGGSYDPALAERFCRLAVRLLPLIEPASVWDAILDIEPVPQRWLSEEQIDDALHAIADFTDLRSPSTVAIQAPSPS
jgi:hypothetical protein